MQERLTFNLVELGHALRDVLGRPESPLYEPLLSEPLGSLIPYLAALEQLPLQGCGYPEQLAGGEVWQMECEWELGSLRYHGFLRLVHLGGQPYVVSAFASDPRRLRHLEAIANGF